jgi:hypothetical protein
MDVPGYTLAVSFGIGPRSWGFRRVIRHQVTFTVIVVAVLEFALFAAVPVLLVAVPVHYGLRAAGRPGILRGEFTRSLGPQRSQRLA